MFGGEISFIIGLGITQFIDGISMALQEQPSIAIKTVTLLINLLISGVFVIFNIFAKKGKRLEFPNGDDSLWN